MQATVMTFDAETGAGTVVADSGSTIAFGSEAFLASGLLLLRAGQRVRLVLTADGVVESVTVATFAPPPTTPRVDAQGDRT